MFTPTAQPTAANGIVTVQSLGSGSSGNAFLVTHGPETVLVDCGVGIRMITRALRERGLGFGDLSAVLVTHEHSDHIRTLPKVLTGGTPLYATEGTVRRGRLPRDAHQVLRAHTPVEIAGMTVWPMAVSHDATEPCGFLLDIPGSARIAVLTDLGCWHDSLAEYVSASDLIVLEANHDEEILRRGPYPTHLKRRVASAVGHLSNRACGIALGQALRGSTHRPEVWLAHLSETNNRAGLALATVRAELVQHELELDVLALPRLTASPIWTPTVPGGRKPAIQRRPEPVPLQQLSLRF